MSAPISPEDICNLSLDLLRHSALVSSLSTPESEEESLGSRWYDATRRSVLQMFPWNFAKKRAKISRDATVPAFGYPDAYVLPNDYLAPVFIGEDPEVDYEIDFSVEGDRLLIDNSGAASLQLCYIYDNQDITKFDPIFMMLLVAELAIVFGNSIAGLNKSIKGMEALRDRWEAKARAKNGHENPPKVRSRSPLLARRTGVVRSRSYDGKHLL